MIERLSIKIDKHTHKIPQAEELTLPSLYISWTGPKKVHWTSSILHFLART
ncbi:protein of unknown function [Streptococcus thermophilus]|uniref:Uncharacterized protein n=1 Tax=Streptococcus thermophilus TaxID=1308 RepID=A0AAU9H7A9_STRTR|nr:protein of unknown function [Streptococcus thermophilus]